MVDQKREGRDDGPELTDEDELLLDLAWQKIAEEDRAAGRTPEE